MLRDSRTRSRLLVAVAAIGLAIAFAFDAAEAKPKPGAEDAPAEDASGKANKRKPTKNEKAEKAEKPADKGSDKPEQLGNFGEWGAYAAQSGRNRTCYALGQPKERTPKAKLKDATAYIFISTRPAENIHNEVAINLGYATKDGSAAVADIDGDSYELITKGTNAWVKDQSREKEFVGALRGGAKLIVKAASSKGTSTTDSYSLKGMSDALARAVQECK
ncbi:invasion associated locus B family protein [Methylocystis sp. SB2]|uniref:invasion associated locus B family protein n=1 Tax=Methylocystis sp. (strain SB2) TaxID=743836 RepID=UPI0003FFB958|nr:invasion associated locus B family protein [Methylocystis sp. SB2]ULO24140.1 invasion associated locus B family protein [Methylocystis sp. SB2]